VVAARAVPVRRFRGRLVVGGIFKIMRVLQLLWRFDGSGSGLRCRVSEILESWGSLDFRHFRIR
jgi:hypothetical protein